MDDDNSIHQSAQNLGIMVCLIGVIFVVIGAIAVFDNNKTGFGTIILAAILILCGYGITKKIHIAYWIALILFILYFLSGILDVCIGAGWMKLDGYSATVLVGVVEIIASGTLLVYTIGSKDNVLE